MRKLLIMLLCLVLLFTAGCMSQKEKDEEISRLIALDLIESAKNKIAEYYKDDEEKTAIWLEVIKEMEEIKNKENYIEKLVIQDETKSVTVKGNYSYIRGRVTNTGDEVISYFKITAQYLDENNNVLDSDYTNSGEKIRPSDSKEFEIMHRHNDEYKKYRIFVEEVNIE